jgi:beta-glucosidase
LSSSSGSKGGTLIASVNITNSGNFDGEEVVQLYIRDLAASIIRPVKELKGFQKIKLKKGEKSTVQFTLTDNEFSFFNADGMTKLEPVRFHIFVGPDSKNTQKLDFDLK